jgi:hypothetical protein
LIFPRRKELSSQSLFAGFRIKKVTLPVFNKESVAGKDHAVGRPPVVLSWKTSSKQEAVTGDFPECRAFSISIPKDRIWKIRTETNSGQRKR